MSSFANVNVTVSLSPAFNISVLSNARRFTVDFSIPDKSKLSIPFFDDKIYEIYPNDLWLKKAISKDGKQLMLQAKGLIWDKKLKKGEWKRICVSNYNEKNDTFDGFIDNKEKTEFHNMPKLYILFDRLNKMEFKLVIVLIFDFFKKVGFFMLF